MRHLLPIAVTCALLTPSSAAQQGTATRTIAWEDLAPPARARLMAAGLGASSFPALISRLHREHAERVREGDLDHLVFYVLQSAHFSALPPIEPALSAKAVVDALPDAERDRFLRTGAGPGARVPAPVHARIGALLRALDSPDRDPRIAYFRTLVQTSFPNRRTRERDLEREYLRAMRFLYQKEFVAQRSPDAAEAVEDLYQSRGLSTDTAVEAGYLVYLGLGVVRSLEPERRVRRVLIVGPGLDLAPRTGLLESGPPESYQPWAVIDALISLGLAKAGDLRVVAADINPRVVDHLRRARAEPPTLRLVSGIAETESVGLTPEYREYFAGLGRAAGKVDAAAVSRPGHLAKTVTINPTVARILEATPLDIVTERLDATSFDLAIATNILPYFDDAELTLAVSNVAAMLAPGGMFLHNEARPAMREIAAAAGLSFEQSRQAIIASVRGAAAPLGDSIWILRRPKE